MNIRPYRHHLPQIATSAYIDPAGLIIGNVEIDEDASIWPFTVVRGDVNAIRIGARTNIQDSCVLHVTHAGPYSPSGYPLYIGADVTVGHGVILHACTVEEACLIGMGATVLDGALIKKHAFVGAGALVAPGKVVGAGELWLGNPARMVRKLSDQDIEQLYYSAQHYVRLKNDYLAMLTKSLGSE